MVSMVIDVMIIFAANVIYIILFKAIWQIEKQYWCFWIYKFFYYQNSYVEIYVRG